MGMTFHVDIVSAEKEIFSGRAELLTANAALGEIGIIPGHAQLLTSLEPGQVRLVLPEEKEEFFYISGGLLEVQPHLVTVLANTAVRAGDIDEAQAKESMQQAKDLLADKSAEVDYAKALAELAEAAAQIRAIENLRKKMKR